MANELLQGKRFVKVTKTKKKRLGREYMSELAQLYKDAIKITLVMDILGTHKPGVLYETFKPDEAKKLILYTPQNMAIGYTWPKFN